MHDTTDSGPFADSLLLRCCTSDGPKLGMLKDVIREMAKLLTSTQREQLQRTLTHSVFPANSSWSTRSCHRCGRALPEDSSLIQYTWLCPDCREIVNAIMTHLRVDVAEATKFYLDFAHSAEAVERVAAPWVRIDRRLYAITSQRKDRPVPVLHLRYVAGNTVTQGLTEFASIADLDGKIAADMATMSVDRRDELVDILASLPRVPLDLAINREFAVRERRSLLEVIEDLSTFVRVGLWERLPPSSAVIDVWVAMRPFSVVYRVRGATTEDIPYLRSGQITRP